jgi:hypothetical protein
MFRKAMGHVKKKTFAAAAQVSRRERWKAQGDGRLLLPGALLVTIQAQLLAPFMFVDLCLAAFFQ